MLENRKCKYDGKEFVTKTKTKVFCSEACSAMYRYYNTPGRKEKSKINSLRWKNNNLTKWKSYYKDWYLKNKESHYVNIYRRRAEKRAEQKLTNKS